jgi:hypothetical protein
VLILGGGPNRIGQGIEFDYCCCHASFSLRDAGYETIMMNSNPETVSTDYDTSSRLYFEPLTVRAPPCLPYPAFQLLIRASPHAMPRHPSSTHARCPGIRPITLPWRSFEHLVR